MKNQTISDAQQGGEGRDENSSSITSNSANLPDDPMEDDGKENDPFSSPSPMHLSRESSRRDILGKRPLSELPTPIDLDDGDTNSTVQDEKVPHGRLPNIDNSGSGHVRKSPRLDISAGNLDCHGKSQRESFSFSAKDGHVAISPATDFGDDKENMEVIRRRPSSGVTKPETQHQVSQAAENHQRPTLRKVSNVGPSRLKGQARIGIRRL
jgi:ubiquitin-conjugating enzyme E2 S